VITPGEAADLDELAARLLAFQEHYNAAAEPFDWTSTSAKLNALLERLTTHPTQTGSRRNPRRTNGRQH
jgi:hypothetical protein